MRSKNWDTRVAAGDAIDAIAKNVPANIAKKVKDETGIKGAEKTGHIHLKKTLKSVTISDTPLNK